MAATHKKKIGGPGMVGPNVFAEPHPPSVDDDIGHGVGIGDQYIDTSQNEVYFCFDNARGAAVWGKMAFAIDG